MQTQAEADITDGASVLLIDPIDTGSGAAIEKNAESKGVKVIDYDRLVLGGPADRYYVSFNNVKVGQLIGQGEVGCITAWNVQKPNILIMDGDPTDNNATLFAQGYNGVLDAEVRQRHLREGRRAGRHVGSADRPDHVRAAVHRAPEHQRRGHAERRQRQRRDRGPEEQEDPAEDVPDHRSGRVARRVCRTSSRATSAAPCTSRSTSRRRPRQRSPCTCGPARRRRPRW